MAKHTFDTATDPEEHGQWGIIHGQPIIDDMIDGLVADAKDDFPRTILNPVGRPRTVGTKRAETVTVRLDAVRRRAHDEHASASAITRRALDEYLAN